MAAKLLKWLSLINNLTQLLQKNTYILWRCPLTKRDLSQLNPRTPYVLTQLLIPVTSTSTKVYKTYLWSPYHLTPTTAPPCVVTQNTQSSLSWRWARVARSREPDVFLAPLCRSCQLASHCCGEGGGVSFGYEANVWPLTKGRLLDPVTSSLVAYLPSVGSGFQAQNMDLPPSSTLWKKEEDLKSVPQFCLQWCTRSQCGVVR